MGVLLVSVLQAARAGHESPFYPSFYPQEIRIETLDPGAAKAGWSKARSLPSLVSGVSAGVVLLVAFVGEAVRDALDPRKTLG